MRLPLPAFSLLALAALLLSAAALRPAAATPPTPDAGPQVAGGTPVAPGEHPWQAAVVFAGFPNPYTALRCGGVLLDAQTVLTAAHCVVQTSGLYVPPLAPLDVVLGTVQLSAGPTHGESGQRIAVQRVAAHPDYNHVTLEADLALLRLAAPAALDENTAPLAYATEAQAALLAAGVTATVAGWGHTENGSPLSDQLLQAQTPLVAREVCNASGVYHGRVSANMLCAGPADGSVGTCNGDSGGPLLAPDGGGWLLAGITSWGIPCATGGYYDVYTRVASFAPWLDAQLNPLPPLYLPLVRLDGPGCDGGPLNDTDNLGDAYPLCSGQPVTAAVDDQDDLHDVYTIQAAYNQKLTLTLASSGGDADLYLYPPSATDIYSNPWVARSVSPAAEQTLTVYIFKGGAWGVRVTAASGAPEYTLTATVGAQ